MQDTLVLNTKLVINSLYNISIKCHLDTGIRNTQRCVFYFMERYIIEPILTKILYVSPLRVYSLNSNIFKATLLLYRIFVQNTRWDTTPSFYLLLFGAFRQS